MSRLRLSSIRPLFAALFAAGLLAGTAPPAPSIAAEVPAPSLPLAVSSFNPLPVTFDTVSIRATPPSRTVVLENLGSADLTVTGIVSADPEVTVTDTQGNPISTLGPIVQNGTAAFRVRFAPTAAKNLDTTLTITSNDAFNPVYQLPVTGEAVDVQITVTPSHRLILPNQNLTFTALLTGASSKAVTWSIEPPTGAGSITQNGIYQAPSTPVTTVRVIATSVADPLTSSEATVRVFSPETTQNAATTLGAGALGESLAAADLDGDGLIEVISGAPLADVGIVPGAGQIWIRSFDGQGFSQPAILLTAPVPGTGAGFGTAILARDIDGDGNADLIVGEPGAAGGGAVHVFAGFAAGSFAKHGVITVAGGAATDEFGAALALGTFSGTTEKNIAVGAPGTTVSGLPNAGRVHVVAVTDASTATIALSLVPALQRSAPVAANGARFGQALTAGCFNGCTQLGLAAESTQVNDLVVGAPGATVTDNGVPLIGAGRAYAYTDQSVAGVLRYLDKVTEITSPAPAAGAQFGAALATGDMTFNAVSDLFVAAPGQPVTEGTVFPSPTAGAIFLYLPNEAGQFAYFVHLRDAGATSGQNFGASLHIADLDGDLIPDLTVGINNPTGIGSVATYYGSGFGDFSRVRRFVPTGVGVGDRYGSAIARADLNGDGVIDLIVGAPGTGVGAVGGAGSLYTMLDNPPSPVRAAPSEPVVGLGGNAGTGAQFFAAQGSLDSWDLVGGIGTITSQGIYTPPVTIPGPLDDMVLVRMADQRDPNQWGLARIRLLGRTSALAAPEITILGNGQAELGLPEEGINFGSEVDIAPLGRPATDPYRSLSSVVGGFRAVNTGVVPRLNSYPYDDLPDVPFGGLQFYPGQNADRTGWGAQIVHGDFNGDGNIDIAVSAPFASSEEASGQREDQPLAQVGFVDIFFLDAEGNIGTYLDTQQPSAVRLQVSPFTINQNSVELWPANPIDPTAPRDRANTRWGHTLLAHDMNGDGRADLIVGAPHADVTGVRDAGLVEVLLAPSTPAGDWRPGVERVTLTEPTPRQGAYFGSAIAVGNIAGDGKQELFVGAPGREPDGVQALLRNDAIVYGFKPEPPAGGLPADNWKHPDAASLRAALNAATPLVIPDPTPPPAGHFSGFGQTIVVGNLNPDDAADELAIGAPFRPFLNSVFLDPFGNRIVHDGGDVSIYDAGTGFTVTGPKVILPPVQQADMRFGKSMALATLSAVPGTPPTLAVGAPFQGNSTLIHAGTVYLFDAVAGGTPIYRTRFFAPQATSQQSFGEVIAAGDLNNDGIDELAIGAPSSTIDQYVGFRVIPGRFGGLVRLFNKREQAGRVYVIFPNP